MREVACKGLDMFFDELRRRGLSEELLARDTGYPLAHLRDKTERISWQAFLRLMENARAVWTDEEFVEMGGAFTRSPLARSLVVIARLLFAPLDVYKWIATPGKGGVGNQLFSCIVPSYREVGERRIVIELAMQAGYAPCREFFLTSKGSFIYLPKGLGLAAAQVTMRETPTGAQYEIVVPRGGGLLTRLYRFVTWPFTVRSAARELKEANELLQARYEDLARARDTLDRQATQLRTAHTISQLIHGDLDLDRTVGAVAHALLEAAGFAAVEVVLEADAEGRTVQRDVREGAPPPAVEKMLIPLVGGGRPIGSLALWPAAGADRQERHALLDFVVPGIEMALAHALTFHALADYRENLERMVAERTAALTQARDELAATVTRLREAQATRDRLFANINHEIRTPLTLVMLAAGDIQRRQAHLLDDASRQRLDSIAVSVRRLLRLIDGLLLLAAGQEGKLRLRPAPLDLAATLRQLVATWAPHAESHGLALGYEGPRRATVTADEGAIDRVVGNLISNAVKFTPSGGSIEVRLAEAPDGVEIAVRDSGIGIDQEFRSRIFGRFEQGRPAVHAGAHGSGVGLSIVKQLVEAHGGAVDIESPRDGGSVFRVRLPRAPLRGADPPVESGALPSLRLLPEDYGHAATPLPAKGIVEPPRGATAAATLLVAEDDPELRLEIARALGDQHRVLLAADGITALQLARKHLPDLLVSDVGMPGMDGLELTRRFRELPGNRLAPVLLVTAHGNLADRLSGFDAGAIDYIAKPFDPDELRARVRNQLALRGMALKLHESEKLVGLGVLSAGLAHELRNPANALVNAIPPLRSLLPRELTARETPSGQLLDVLETCAAQIGMLSRQLLGFKRPGSLALEDTPVSAIVARALALVRPALKTVTLHTESTYDGTVPCAAPLVTQVLTNLLENAAHAAGPKGWIKLATRLEERSVVIEVQDSGPGVPRELQARIFEPFFTTKPPGHGTGLGLTTSREIVEQHHGTLEVRDGPKGTVFRVTLPLTQPSVSSTPGLVDQPARLAARPGSATA